VTGVRLAIGADHRGHATAAFIVEHLRVAGHTVEVFAPATTRTCDYPEPAYRVARAVADDTADFGVLVCGSGIGMSISANKVPGVRAALVHDAVTAELSREHLDANVICLPGDLLSGREMQTIVELWLATPFEGGRHVRRLRKIEAIERGIDPSTVTDQRGGGQTHATG